MKDIDEMKTKKLERNARFASQYVSQSPNPSFYTSVQNSRT